MNITECESELRKRLPYPYRWNGKQTDTYDRRTRFVYDFPSFDDVHDQINRLLTERTIQDYALNRWFNYWSAQGIRDIFLSHPSVTECPDPYSKTVDFYINGIPFDHKTTVFPRGFPGPVRDAMRYPPVLIDWLYDNQSKEQRHHMKNRLFIVLYANDGKHWKLKADLHGMRTHIIFYLDHFEEDQLYTLPNGSRSDCIWYIG